jgi:hypothetical protein
MGKLREKLMYRLINIGSAAPLWCVLELDFHACTQVGKLREAGLAKTRVKNTSPGGVFWVLLGFFKFCPN